jgi:hypothetical protein
MIIHAGDYTFCGEDTRPHQWALKTEYTQFTLRRLTYEQFCDEVRYDPKAKPVGGRPSMYYVSHDGGHATFYPPADKDYELVQIPDAE